MMLSPCLVVVGLASARKNSTPASSEQGEFPRVFNKETTRPESAVDVSRPQPDAPKPRDYRIPVWADAETNPTKQKPNANSYSYA
jgi:hypothetical protein